MKWVSVIDLKARGQQGMDTVVFAQLDRGIPMGPRKPRAAIWMGPPNPDDNWWTNNGNTKPRWLDWFLSLSDYFPVPKACLACGASHPHANGYCSTLCAKEEWQRLENKATARAIEHRRLAEERKIEIAAAKQKRVEARAERQRKLLEGRAKMRAEIDYRQGVRRKKREVKEMKQMVKRVMEEERQRRRVEKEREDYLQRLQEYRDSLARGH